MITYITKQSAKQSKTYNYINNYIIIEKLFKQSKTYNYINFFMSTKLDHVSIDHKTIKSSTDLWNSAVEILYQLHNSMIRHLQQTIKKYTYKCSIQETVTYVQN